MMQLAPSAAPQNYHRQSSVPPLVPWPVAKTPRSDIILHVVVSTVERIYLEKVELCCCHQVTDLYAIVTTLQGY